MSKFKKGENIKVVNTDTVWDDKYGVVIEESEDEIITEDGDDLTDVTVSIKFSTENGDKKIIQVFPRDCLVSVDEVKESINEGANGMNKLKLTLEELNQWMDDNDANYWTQDIANNEVTIYGLNEAVGVYNFKDETLTLNESKEADEVDNSEDDSHDFIEDYVYLEDIDGKKHPSWYFVDKISVAENVTDAYVSNLIDKYGYSMFYIEGPNQYFKAIVAAPEITAKDIEEEYVDYLLGSTFTVTKVEHMK